MHSNFIRVLPVGMASHTVTIVGSGSDAISVKVKISSSILLTDFDKYLPHHVFEYLCALIRVIKCV